MWRVKIVKPLPDYCLALEMMEGETGDQQKGVFDMKPYLDLGVFQELKNIHYFNQVYVFMSSISWPHEQDL